MRWILTASPTYEYEGTCHPERSDGCFIMAFAV